MARDKSLNIKVRATGTRRAKKQVRGLSGAFKGLAASAATALAPIFAITAAYKAIAGTIKVGAEFEQSMANLKAITNANRTEFEELEKMARRLGGSTKFTASQVAGLATEYAKLGFTTQEIQNVSNDTLALAAAIGAELPEAAAVAGATLRGFGIDASDTGRVTNLMAASFSKSALDMTKFRESMKYIAPVASAAGFEIEGTTALLAQLANVGIDGSMAGTSLKNVFLKLSDTSSVLSKTLGGPVDNMDDLVLKLRQLKAGGMDLNDALTLTDRRSAAAFLTLVRGADDLKTLEESITNTNEAERMMAEQLNTLKGRTDIMISATQELGIELFESGEGPLKKIVERLTSFITKTKEVVKFIKTIDLKETFMNFDFSAYWKALLDSLVVIFDFIPEALTAALNAIWPMISTWGQSFLDAISILAKTLWEPIPIAAQIMGQKILKQFSIMSAEVKNTFTPMINFLKEQLNEVADTWLGQKLGIERMEPSDLINVEGIGDEFDKVIATLQAKGQDTALMQFISGLLTAEDIDTQQQLVEALGDIWANYAEGLVVKNEELKEALGEDEEGKPKPLGAVDAIQVEAQMGMIQQISDMWIDETGKMKLRTAEQTEAIKTQGKAFLKNMSIIGKEFPAAEKIAKRFAQVQATVDAIAAANAAYKAMAGIPVVGPALGIAAGAAALMAGYANVRKIEAAATGYDDIVNRPTMFLAGEAGSERVSVTPLEGPNINGPQGSNITVNFSGNVMSQDFLENEAIPQIKEAIRRGADIGVS